MRIAIIITGLGIGGAEKRQLTVLESIDRSRYELDYFCIYDEDNCLIPRFRELGARVNVLKVFDYSKPFPLRISYTAIIRLVKMLRKGRYDVVHTQLPHANTVGRIAARLAGIKCVIATICNMEARTRLQVFWDRYLGKQSYAIMCISRSTMEYDRAHTCLPLKKYRVIHNGIDSGKFSRRRLKKMSENYLGLSSETFAVGSVGRLDAQKNFPFLIEAFRLFSENVSNAALVIVGGGPEHYALKELSVKLGIANLVMFLGPRNDVVELLSCFDIYVCSSIFEGFGNSLVEAMSMELPIVATDLLPTREIVSDGVDGLLVPTAEPTLLAKAMIDLYSNYSLRQRLGRNARAKVLDMFTEKIMVEHLQQLYSEAFKLEGSL